MTRDAAGTGDDVMTFRFGAGQLVSRAILTFSPASTEPGFFYVGTHAQGDTIVPERGTGAYASTGRLRMAGWHDGREFSRAGQLRRLLRHRTRSQAVTGHAMTALWPPSTPMTRVPRRSASRDTHGGLRPVTNPLDITAKEES
jgi:hypothetical protein